jgi:COMPASS component SWD3
MTSPGFVLARTLEGHSKSVSAVRFSPDGSRVASASADKTVRVWSVADGTQLCVLVGHERGCSDVAWTSDGRYLASASDDKNLHLWDVDPSSPHYARTVRVFAGHTSHVFCCDVNSRCGADNILASGSVDETVRMWDVRHGVCLNVLPAHSDPVTGVKFSPDGTVLLTCSYDGMIRAWAVATGACLKTVVLGSSGVHKGCIGNGSSGDEDENLRTAVIPGFVGNAVDDIAALADGVVINGGAGWGDGASRNAPVGAIATSSNGRYLLASTLDGTVKLWDSRRGRVVRIYRGRRGERYCSFASFAECGGETYAVCGSEDGAVMTWNLQTGDEAQRIAGSMDAWEHVRADEKRAKAKKTKKGEGGSPGTPERTTEEKKEGSDAMDVDGDGENAAVKNGDGDGSEDAKDGDEEDVEDEPSPPPPTDPSGHGDAVVGLDFLNGMLATSGLERDRTIKLWTTSAYRSQHA